LRQIFLPKRSSTLVKVIGENLKKQTGPIKEKLFLPVGITAGQEFSTGPAVYLYQLQLWLLLYEATNKYLNKSNLNTVLENRENREN
jgi:hypothetical protein